MDKHEHDTAFKRAVAVGTEHGTRAGAWAIDGNTSQATITRFLVGIADGDPEILDNVPSPDLSGQWADGYSSQDLTEEVEACDDCSSDACDAYEAAFTSAAEDEITRAGRAMLSDDHKHIREDGGPCVLCGEARPEIADAARDLVAVFREEAAVWGAIAGEFSTTADAVNVLADALGQSPVYVHE